MSRGAGSSRPLIHSLCMPVPLCAPTPARRSSSFFLIRHTIRGHLGSLGRSDLPLKKRTARSRSDWEDRLTKAHCEREIKKIEEGPCHSGDSSSSGKEGTVELKYFQSSSCEVLPGLALAVFEFTIIAVCDFRRTWTHTLPTHMTQSLLLAGGCG